ncbi:subtilisin-like protein [Saccharata proteae CBS 121410]|uniref:Subtilisin-like protein n=1 Tax=Saccharata proteae CBS 121410 TaxID=1314787 RepID=A0A9P4I0A8_9PEZI|nr:subtilisin-like protein [Saccharata proteae CBS 121410]
MLAKSLCWGLFALDSFCAALPAPQTHAIHEKRESLHPRWAKRSRVHPDSVLPMRIGLTQNMDNAVNHLMDVSDPSSSNYGKHWTPEKVVDMFKPAEETIEAVREWLVQSGIAAHRITHTDNKGWFAFQATSEEAERLLHTEFHEYEDAVTGGVLPACDEYHVPRHIQHHIDYITPGIKLIAPDKGKSKGLKKRAPNGQKSHLLKQHKGSWNGHRHGRNLSNCDVAITPDCISALYHIPPVNYTVPNPNNSMGIFESEEQYYSQVDLDVFFANFTPKIPQGTHPILASIDGAPGPTTDLSDAGGEADLDIQLAYPIIYPQTITLYDTDDSLYEMDPNITYTYGFNTFLDALDGSYCTYSAYGETGNDPDLDPVYPDPRPGGYNQSLQCGVYKPTNVISVSYGGQEADIPAYYQKRQCNEWLKLGLQGVSVFFASGDAGVGNYPAPNGFDNPDTGCLGPTGKIFNPTWPNNCPWLTNVGATKVYPGKTVFEPESAVFDPAGHPYSVNYSSGGGFSNIYPIPAYQASAVATFFAEHDPSYPSYSRLTDNVTEISSFGDGGGIYNRIGRGIPDVAANGDNIAVYVGGDYELSGGTSASTPIFASIVNRINEERLNAGKGSIGFINPALYANPCILNDITNGTNPGCWTEGFSAVKGWDPVTGLGTPNFAKMLEYFLALP